VIFGPPLILLFYVLIGAYYRWGYRIRTKHIVFGALCVPFFCFFHFFVWFVLVLQGILNRSTFLSRRAFLALIVCYFLYDPALFGWFLRRTYRAFLNGVNGEATNSDDVPPGTQKYIRKMRAMGVPIEELDIDVRDFEPRPAGAPPTRSTPPPPPSVPPSVAPSEDTSASPPEFVHVPWHEKEILVMLPETRLFAYYIFVSIFMVYLSVFLKYFCEFMESIMKEEFSREVGAAYEELDDLLRKIFNNKFHEDTMLAASARGMAICVPHKYKPLFALDNGLLGGSYVKGFLPEYNAAYDATVDTELADFLLEKFLSHKDVASTLNTMFEGAKKHPRYSEIPVEIMYHSVLYAYQTKKVKTREANCARGKCEAQMVQLN